MEDWNSQWNNGEIHFGEPYIGNRHDKGYSKKQARHYKKQQNRYRRMLFKQKMSRYLWVLILIALVIGVVIYNVTNGIDFIGPDVNDLTNR